MKNKKYISTLHYTRLNSDEPEMLDATLQTVPPLELEESQGGQGAFPKHCPNCGGDELSFSRVEDRSDTGGDGFSEFIKAYKIHYVVCINCGEEGELEDFQ